MGLGVIILGFAGGLYLILKQQSALSQTAPNLTPKNIIVTNIVEDSAVVSWQTNSPVTSMVSFGQNSPGEQTALDDRNNNALNSEVNSYTNHYVTLKNLLPKTTYQFKIISGKISSEVERFQTAAPLTRQADFNPVIGSVLDGENPLQNGIVYLFLSEAVTQSFLIKTGGNFLIPLSQIRKTDLSDIYEPMEGSIGKLTIRSANEDTNVSFKLSAKSPPLPPIKLGEDTDLTAYEASPEASPSVNDLNKYDLNADGKINSADNAIILQNFGKKPKNKQSEDAFNKADLNKDGVVDQKDLDLMSQKLKALSSL